MERKYEILENSKTNLNYVKLKIEEIQNWINKKNKDLDEKKIFNYNNDEIEKILTDLKNVNKEIDSKQIFLDDSLTVKLNVIELESEPIEFNDIEENLFKPTIKNLSILKTSKIKYIIN